VVTKSSRTINVLCKEIRKWQDKNTGTSNVKLNKEQSKSMLINVCPLCEFDGICEIDTESYGGTYKKCKIKSWDLQITWVMISEEKATVEVGKKYGKLLVLNRRTYIAKPFRKETSANWWICQCDCGNYRTVRGHDLTTGNTKSCGCIPRGGDRKSDSYRNRVLSESTISLKKNRYRRGSSRNPDGSRHAYQHEDSSRIGQALDVLVKSSDPDKPDYYVRAKCQGCVGGVIRRDIHSYNICDKCGLVN
jgi:hypothetical protein